MVVTRMTFEGPFRHDGGLMPVTLEITDGVALILVDHSPAGLDDSELAALRAALGAAASDAGAVVLHGGDRTFFSGIDLKRVMRTPPVELKARAARIRNLCHEVARMSIPVVAAIGGDAFGTGCALALACDARVMTRRGSLGWVTAAEAEREILMGRRLTAQEALRMGMVDRVVEPCALLASARELAVSHATRKPRKRTQEYAKVL
jgi:enoyl-CoA hydratase/carnithine racemase